MASFILNGEKKTIAENCSILNLIESYELDVKKIAIEKNLEIIEPEKFASEKINEGDKIEIVHFIGGG